MSEDEATPRARSFWSGTISFGLVSIPVDLYPASRPARTSLRMLDADGTPLRRRFFDASDKPVESDALVRGYEIDKDEFVEVTDEELESLEPRKSRDIDLRLFVEQDSIEPLYFERAYFLTPSGNSNKAYRLLARTMERTGKAGIATFVMRTKEYLVAILAENGILRAETLRFHDEVRTPADVGLPEPVAVPAAAVQRVVRVIAKHTESELATAELKDGYAERLRALVERKRDRGVDVVAAPAAAGADAEDDDIIDLMQILKRSMKAAGDADSGSGKARPARARPRAAGAATRTARAATRTAARSSRAGGAPAKRAAKTSSSGASKRASSKPSSGGASKRPSSKASSSGAAKRASKPAGKQAAAELTSLTRAELYERAQALDIPGRSGMDRGELERAIRQAG